MRATAKVTSKGQVTIPVEVRRALGIETGDTLVFEAKGVYAQVNKLRSVLDIAAELREKYPQLSQPPRYATKEEAIEAYFREKAVREEAEGRYGDEIYIVGPGGSVRFDPPSESS